MIMRQLIDLSSILDLSGYLFSLDRWIKINKNQLQPQLKELYVNKYIQVVKPIIHHYHAVISTVTPDHFAFYSHSLQTKQVQTLKTIFHQLNAFQIFAKGEVGGLETNHQYEFMPAAEVKLLFKYPAKEDQLFKVPLYNEPKNAEFAYWGASLAVDSVQFTSNIVHAKGIAKTQLGFPTANTFVTPEIQLSLKDYPSGVYLVQFNIEGVKYGGACNIGSNPEYQNLTDKRVIQTYVLNEFEADFYDSTARIKLLALIRLEGEKFQSFDSFLNAMHNDIYTAKKMMAAGAGWH